MFNFAINKEQVVAALGIESSDPAFQDQVISKLYDQLSQRMFLRVQRELTDEEMKTLDEVSDRNDAEGKAWLNQRFPNNEQMHQEELAALILELKTSLDAVAAASQNPQN